MTFAALAGMLLVAVPEEIAWYHEAGVWLIDEGLPKAASPARPPAVRDAISGVTLFVPLFSGPWPVLGAAVGTGARKLGRRVRGGRVQ